VNPFMSKWRITQVVGLLVVIFAAGTATGVLLAPRFSPPPSVSQRPVPLNPEQRVDDKVAEFTKRLKLTPQQQETVRSLMKGHMAEMQRLNAGRRRRGNEAFEQTSGKIRKQLTPEQQVEYDRMLKEAGRLRPTSTPSTQDER
jgi:hypothetical protein